MTKVEGGRVMRWWATRESLYLGVSVEKLYRFGEQRYSVGKLKKIIMQQRERENKKQNKRPVRPRNFSKYNTNWISVTIMYISLYTYIHICIYVMYISMFVCAVKRKQQRIQSKYHVGPHTPHQSIQPNIVWPQRKKTKKKKKNK